MKGTIFCVSADNLAAHGLGGSLESFRTEYVCRFCMTTNEQFQRTDVRQREFVQRTKASHDLHVQTVLESEISSNQLGVKGNCVLHESLQYFHPVTGFPPDILHYLLQGIVPVELSLCLKEMIHLKFFLLDFLTQKITSFPYQHTDKGNRPKHSQNSQDSLLRLLPLLVGMKVPESNAAWTVLMDLKEVVELALCPSFTDVYRLCVQSQ